MLPQFVGLLLLSTAEYGHFSLIYLLYAFGVSLTLSVLSEPWHTLTLTETGDSWESYASMGLVIGLVIGGCTGLLAWGIGYSTWTLLCASLAIGASVFRGGTRYYLVQRRRVRRAAASDILFVLVLLAGCAVLRSCGLEWVSAIYSAWAIAALVSALIMPSLFRPRISVSGWVRRHHASIRRLLADSLLMDLGAIFTPLLMAPLMGAYAFGTYRALSTVSAPVRLILNPLRPILSGLPRDSASAGGKLWTGVLVSGGILSVGAFAALSAIDIWDLNIGAVTSLVVFRWPVALVVWANFMGHYAYIRSRLSMPGKVLLSGRILQTLLVTVLPLGGLFLWQLGGAIWGMCAASVLTAVSWTLLKRRFSRFE